MVSTLGDEARANLQKIFAYGVRNSFGMTFDPKKGELWTTENGGRAFDEINHVPRGFNGGWVQFMGPLSRVEDYKAIEVAAGIGANGPNGLQQLRFLATDIADTPSGGRGPDVPRARVASSPIRSSAGRTSCRQRPSGSSTATASASSTTAI